MGTELPPKRAQPPNYRSMSIVAMQTAGWIQVPIGTEVGLGPDDSVRWGRAPPPLKKGGTAPNFRFMSLVAKGSPI